MTRNAHLRRPALFLFALASLSCSSLAAAQDSPRKLLEGGAFAEEHEHDFDGAAELYARAADAAHAANDAATEKEANAAKNRVLARQGKAPVADPQAPGELPPQAARLLHDGSLLDPKTDAGKAVIADLAVAGTSIVPTLETMFGATAPFFVGGTMVQPNPIFAIHALAANQSPEASAALARCLESPDPLLRHAIVKVVIPWQQRPLLERAARDSASSVADAAIDQLDNLHDPVLTDVMELAARRGNSSAGRWLARNAPAHLLSVAEDRAVARDARLRALNSLVDGELSAEVRSAERLVALGRDPVDAELHQAALEVLNTQAAHDTWQHNDDLREPVGKLIAAEIERTPTPLLVSALGNVGPSNTPQLLLGVIKKLGATVDDEMLRALALCANNSRWDASGTAFDGWMEIARTAPRSWEREDLPLAIHVVRVRIRPLARSVPLEALARNARNLPDDLRSSYAEALEERVQTETRKVKGGNSYMPAGTLDRAVLSLALAGLELNHNSLLGEVNDCFIGVGDVEQIPLILDLLNDPRGAGSLVSALNTLISRSPARAAELLDQRIAKVAGLPAPTNRELMCVWVLGRLPDPAALTLLRTWYPKVASKEAKHALLQVLVNDIEGSEALPEIVLRYHEIVPEDGDMRAAAIARFGQDLYEPAIPLLGEALKDNDATVRTNARTASNAFKAQREALEEFAAWTNASKEARDSVAELAKLLESPNRDVVLGAVKALGAVQARTALPALVRLLEKNDPELKKAVQDAIAKIGG